MSRIRFVTSERDYLSKHTPGDFTLVSDNWDDFGFKTTYTLHYTGNDGKTTEIGYVKIGFRGMTEEGARTELPSQFSQLSEDFFSLGQGREYYEALMKIPDGTGKLALKALKDIAADKAIYNQIQNEKAFSVSLIREIPAQTVTMQFRRIIAGQAPLTAYNFNYSRRFGHVDTPTLRIDFNVNPDSMPPTNVHVLIGANGVGKSMLLRDFVLVASSADGALGSFQNDLSAWLSEPFTAPFVNVVHVAYSAFDKRDDTLPSTQVGEVKIHAVGLSSNNSKTLEGQFLESFQICKKEPRLGRWISAVRTLELADTLLADMALGDLINSNSYVNDIDLKERFQAMSSGHKIAILTVTRLVELVEEQSLVLLDEPETHLHPPLLSALTRAISDLVIDRNGVAVIATHSPVVLQGVPKSCVWRLQRTGDDLRAFRLSAESFGESVSRLTSEVFHLDVRRTGYHELLSQLVGRTGSVEATLEALDGQLGDEGRFVLSSLAYQKEDDHV